MSNFERTVERKAILDTRKGDRDSVLNKLYSYTDMGAMKEAFEKFKARKGLHLAVKQGWVLNELTTNKQTLEQIFTHLIHSDTINDTAQTAITKRNEDALKTEKPVKTGGVV